MTSAILLRGSLFLGSLVLLAGALFSTAVLLGNGAAASQPQREVIRLKASAGVVPLGFAWAEAYHKVKPSILVELCGNGPDSPKFSALASGDCDLCLSTRAMTKEEAHRVKSGTWTKR